MGSANIGWAVHQLLEGKRVCRSGWNGKSMWLESEQARGVASMRKGLSNVSLTCDDFIWIKHADNRYVPWVCSQTDLLATDWEIVE